MATLTRPKKKLIVLVLAILIGATVMSFRQASMATSELSKSYNRTTTITVAISTDPNRVAKKVIGTSFAPTSFTFLAQAIAIKRGSDVIAVRTPVRVIATSYKVSQLLPGQKIRFPAKIVKSREARVAGLLLARGDIEILTEPSRWARSLGSIRSGLRKVSGAGKSGSLIPGMVIGDTSKQSAEFKNQMRRSGLTHLVAVSGANFAIVSGFVLWGMQFFFRRNNHRLIATAISLVAFITLVRPSPSVLRAAAMAAVLLISRARHQGRDSLPALGFAIAAVVIADPWQARDPGFALSVLATAGLLLLAPRVVEYCQRFVSIQIAGALAPPIAAMALCAPVIIAISGYLSPISIVANVLVAVVVAPITIVGFVAALISPIAPKISQILILIITPFAAWICWVAAWSSQFSVFTLATGVIGFIAGVTILTLIYFGRRKFIIFSLVIILIFSWVQRFPAGQWQIANCDIGQGDSMLINLGRHRAIVIDVGPDPITEDSCLKSFGIREIPLLILTHPHADHIGGLAGAKRGREIAATWFGNINAGTHARIDGIDIKVVWPEGYLDENPNNNSIAALISSKDFSLFAAGDIEPPVQEKLHGLIGKVDIYKVAHHGSRYQDFALISELAPQLAIISVGAGNSYGHPAPSTIAELARVHAKVVRTDIDGAIAISATKHRISFQRRNGRFKLFDWR